MFVSDIQAGENNIYYARCNLKVIKGNYITWINWQAAPEYLPVGTKLKVDIVGDRVTLTDIKTERAYTLDSGAKGDAFLGKFIARKLVTISQYPKDVQENIINSVARIGMRKEQVYVAMGPPAWISSGDTDNKTYEDIMGSNLWVYKRSRFGKNIGVEFNPSTEQVVRTEGIWR
jgi:hypothetical protein